jgi:VCBS repeat-containing protein
MITGIIVGAGVGVDAVVWRTARRAVVTAVAIVGLAAGTGLGPPVAHAAIPTNTAPSASGEWYSTDEDTALTVDAPGVLANDSDIDSDPLTSVVTADPMHGSVTLNLNGSFRYVPDADYNGIDSFSYHASDGQAVSSPATVTLYILPVNDAPTGQPDAYSTAEDTARTVTDPGVLVNDTDPEGDPLHATLVTEPGHGTVELNADGSFTYTPVPDFNGTDTFRYTAVDEPSAPTLAPARRSSPPEPTPLPSAPVTVTITITPVPDPITAPPTHRVIGPSSGARTRLALAALVDNPDHVALTLVKHSDPVHGTVTCTGLVCTYVPDAGFVGTDSFTYTLRTAVGDQVTGTVGVLVQPGGAPPISQPAPEPTLPATGADPRGPLGLAALLILTGAAALATTRIRRRRNTASRHPA